MTVPQVNQYLTGLLGDGQSQTQQSVKPNNTALSPTPQDGGALMAGFDRTNSLQRHLNVNAQGSIIVGNTGGDAVTGDWDSAVADETKVALWVRAALTGRDQSQAAQSRNIPVEVRSAVTAQAYTLPRVLGDMVLRGDDGATYSAVFAQNADADTDLAKANVGLTVNARLGALRVASADFVRLEADAIVAITGETHTGIWWLRAAAACFGRDTSDNTLRQVEARATTAAQSPTAFYRLCTDSIARAFEPVAATNDIVQSLREISGTAGSAQGAVELRSTAYWGCVRGRRFAVTTEGTAVTASNGFTATAPRMTIEAGATNENLIRRIDISVLVAGTTNMQVRVVLDPDARYSSGGTAVTLGARTNMNVGSAATASFTAHYGGITATATDADEREIHYGVIPNSVGGRYIIEFEDGLICGASGTILIYIMDAGGTGTAAINVVLEDANVQ